MVRTSFRTKKGTELPITNLKGKEYLMVAYRLVWLTEEADRYDIETSLLQLTDTQAVARTVLTIYDKEGKALKRVSGTKRETQKDFPDFIEKAETGSLGRALAMAGFGTQFSVQDLDEGNRLADAPLENATKSTPVPSLSPATMSVTTTPVETNGTAPKKASSFRKPKKVESTPEETEWQ